MTDSDCYVCGRAAHNHTDHDYWPIIDAERYFRDESQTLIYYPDGTYDIAAHYISEIRPY